MLSIIVFSKDRALQLHGYLESLLRFSEVKCNDITVLYKDNKKISYKKIIDTFPDVNWVCENNFLDDLKNIILKSNDYIMFGCDDVIFKSDFDVSKAIQIMSKNADIFGFSLRLGKNIEPRPSNFIIDSHYLEWNWKESTEAHWNYPWELDSTIYRKIDIKELICDSSIHFKNPNYLEGDIAENAKKLIKRNRLASFSDSKSIVITVNRVQDTHPNYYDSSSNTAIGILYKRYLKGDRLDIESISKIENTIIHVDSQYFILKNDLKSKKGIFSKIFSTFKKWKVKID